MGFIIIDKNTDIVVEFVEEMSLVEIDQYLEENPDHDVIFDEGNKLLNTAFSLPDEDEEDMEDE